MVVRRQKVGVSIEDGTAFVQGGRDIDHGYEDMIAKFAVLIVVFRMRSRLKLVSHLLPPHSIYRAEPDRFVGLGGGDGSKGESRCYLLISSLFP